MTANQTDFSKITTWIFDLDNTLYPRSVDLFAQIDYRMTAYISKRFDMEPTLARKRQKKYYHNYGTTLRGLMTEENVDPADFLSFVHEIDYSVLDANPNLGNKINQLPGEKIIFTNGTVTHAQNTLDALNIKTEFSEIYDIIWSDHIPKPDKIPYQKLVRQKSLIPDYCCMFEDLPRNLEIPHELGMKTVLVYDDESHHNTETWEKANQEMKHIHHQTANLTKFLESIIS